MDITALLSKTGYQTIKVDLPEILIVNEPNLSPALKGAVIGFSYCIVDLINFI
mgnify:CR=1 FL=1